MIKKLVIVYNFDHKSKYLEGQKHDRNDFKIY